MTTTPHQRRPGQPGYLGPAAEAQRTREAMQGAAATHSRPLVDQDDPATLALFAGELEPSLF